MDKIKVKDNDNKTIKTLDKSVIGLNKLKRNIVEVKNSNGKEKNNTKEETVNDKVLNDIDYYSNKGKDIIVRGNEKGKKAFKETKSNIIKLKKKSIKKVGVKDVKSKIKSTKNVVKTADRTVKTSVKVIKNTPKNTMRMIQFSKNTIKAMYHSIKLAIKATISAIKLAIASTKALISAIIAGGWIAILIIIIVCLIGLVCGSTFGIFFSSESKSSYKLSDVVKEINYDFADKIKTIQETNPHDEYIIESDRSSWEEVLSIYSAKITGGIGRADVMDMTVTKAQILKTIFWDMNTITHTTRTENVTSDYEIDGTTNTKTILTIKIESKTLEEMMTSYNFTVAQLNEVHNLLNDDYKSLWTSVIYGSKMGSADMVQIALGQLGNEGGQPFWSWYGFNNRVEWCATFVSWVANELNYIDTNVVPKFASVVSGISWFQTMNLWLESDTVPSEGYIIFFDWQDDGHPDHVGIVETVENNVVYTVEGNSSDAVKQRQYDINSSVIFGYGVPNY